MGLDRETLRQLRILLHPMATRITNMVARGVVQIADDAKKLAMLQLGVLDGEDVGDAEYHQPYGFASVPLGGAEAVVVFPDGDRSRPLVVAVSDRRYRPTGAEPGEVTVYNHAGAKARFLKDGDIELTPAPGREVFVREEGGDAEPVVKRSEFLKHGHATAATGPVSPPMVSPTTTPEEIAVDFPGTAVLKAE